MSWLLSVSRKRLLLALIVFHLTITVFILAAGRLGIGGSLINETGDLSFASDGVVYRKEAIYQAEILRTRGLASWNAVPFQLHVKIFSLLFIALGGLLGHTILTIEPWNALCYALMAVIVFKLGELVFDNRVGMLAALIVMLWPSFLLHTTQFLKDPMIITATLAVILIVSFWLRRRLTIGQALAFALSGGLLVVLLWRLRREMLLAAFTIVVLGCALLLLRQLIERTWYWANNVSAVLLLAAVVATPLLVSQYRTPPQLMNQRVVPPKASSAPVLPAFLTRLRNEAADTGSAVDTDIDFRTHGDIVRYIPRAAMIGLFAPFPAMWFSEGSAVGRSGRWLSGAEMLVTYFFFVLAGLAVWLERRRLGVHALWVVMLIAVTALGLTVANIGTLYRMRYPFWILLVLLAARGLLHLTDKSRTASS